MKWDGRLHIEGNAENGDNRRMIAMDVRAGTIMHFLLGGHYEKYIGSNLETGG